MACTEPTPVFELFDATLAATAPNLIGLWSTNSSASETAVAFASEAVVDAPLWRANFPDDERKATALLVNSEARLVSAQKELGTVLDRIDLLIPATDSEVKASLAFDVSEGQGLAPPEQELLTSLAALQNGGQAESFGLGAERFEPFHSFAERLQGVTAHDARIETQIQGQTIAQTVVSFTGDVHSVWQEGVNVAQVALHQRTLALTLGSRNTIFQTFSVAIQAALKLSVLLALPHGVILALPATWKFIHQRLGQASAGRDL
jgi:ketosteroid isomerase-like protein